MRLFLYCAFLILSSTLFADPQDATVKEYDYSSEIMNMVMSLGGIIFVILVLSFFIKRIANKRIHSANEQNTIKILEKRSLTPKSSIYLIEILGKTFVIGESATGLHSLGEFGIETDLTTVIDPPKPQIKSYPISFLSILKKKLKT